MKSDNYKLMLLAGALSASFAAKAVVTAGASNVLKVSNDGESSLNSVSKDAGKATDANVYERPPPASLDTEFRLLSPSICPTLQYR